jgi:hypothetical protein
MGSGNGNCNDEGEFEEYRCVEKHIGSFHKSAN